MTDGYKKIAFGLPSLLLIAVACTQIIFAFSQNLDPWKGGGFGMFSGLDGSAKRSLSCIGTDADGNQYLISIENSFSGLDDREYDLLNSLVDKSYFLPTKNNLKALAELILHVPIVAQERYDLRDIAWLEKTAGVDLKLAPEIKKSTVIYRLASEEDAQDEAISKISLSKVELGMWRLKFYPEHNAFRWKAVSSFDLKTV